MKTREEQIAVIDACIQDLLEATRYVAAEWARMVKDRLGTVDGALLMERIAIIMPSGGQRIAEAMEEAARGDKELLN